MNTASLKNLFLFIIIRLNSMSSFPYDFGISQEDAFSEWNACNQVPGDYLCIASAGEVPLNLFALGAQSVTAIDFQDSQLFLCELKLKSACLWDGWDAAAFLGMRPQKKKTRLTLYKELRESLSPAAQVFWDQHLDIIEKGVVFQGRFERYIKKLSLAAPLLIGRKKLLGLLETEEPLTYFNSYYANSKVKFLFKLGFREKKYGKKALPKEALQHNKMNLADSFLDGFRRLCTQTPPKENMYLQLFLFGKLLYKEALPPYLQKQFQKRIQNNESHLHFLKADIRHIPQKKEGYDALILSNVCDWLSEKDFQDLLSQIHIFLKPQGRLFWRHLYSKQYPDLVKFKKLETLSQALEKKDLFPFYGFHLYALS